MREDEIYLLLNYTIINTTTTTTTTVVLLEKQQYLSSILLSLRRAFRTCMMLSLRSSTADFDNSNIEQYTHIYYTQAQISLSYLHFLLFVIILLNVNVVLFFITIIKLVVMELT